MTIYNHAVFPSIITEVDCACFYHIQQPLIDWIYEYQKTDEGVTISNRGGWQSHSDFYKKESFSEYLDYILQNSFFAVKFYNQNFKLSNMWININKKDSYNTSHTHPLSLLSGVFWVKAPDNCGNLVFNNPQSFIEHELLSNATYNTQTEKNYLTNISFNPSAGKIILFPSHLRHHVEQNEFDGDRISIAFNLNV
jgi:uncharacterized protein (TIGR02466 family)